MKYFRTLFIAFFLGLLPKLSPAFAQKNVSPILEFGLFADTQYGNCEPGKTRFYRESLGKLKECVDSLNAREVQFTINLGDIIDRSQEDLTTVLLCLKHLHGKVYHLTGNHDYKGVKDNQQLYHKLGMPSEYYSFEKKNWIFVMLNTNEVAGYSNVKGTPKEKELMDMRNKIKSTGGLQGANWNGGISNLQLAWLDDILKKNQKKKKNVLIFSHHPLYPKTEFTALNNLEILEVIERYDCVKAIFAGHHHAGEFGYLGNIPVITAEGMIETPDKNAFGIVRIYKDEIVIEGKGRMTSRHLPLKK